MKQNRSGRGRAGSINAVIVSLIGALAALVLPGTGVRAVAEAYVPLVPARLLDTRAGGATVDGRFAGQGLLENTTVTLAVLGRGGVPADGVTAVVVNVTVVQGETSNGFVTVHPAGSTRPNASSLNFGPGTTVANELVAKVGTGGALSLYVEGRAHLLVDVVGWLGGGPALTPFEVHTLAAGTGLSCAVTPDAGVACWGDNSDGALGNGTTTDSNVPVVIPGLTGVVSVAVGGLYACALTSEGSVFCWGANFGGQLGDGTLENRTSPVKVAGVPRARAVASGNGLGTCVLSTLGEVWCVGGFTFGTTPRRLQVSPGQPLNGVVSISAGGGHGCALTVAAQVYCFGSDTTGATGPGTQTGDVKLVEAVTGATTVAAGGAHSCALMPAATVMCWGENGTGQLGTGQVSATPSPTPVAVAGLSTVVDLAAGTGNGITCGVRADTTLWCWGTNSSGELGNGATSAFSATPTQVVGLSDVRAASAGFAHTCALLGSGAVRCWGFNFSGQVGDGTNSSKSSPSAVSALIAKLPSAFTPPTPASGFEPLVPARVVDTRTGGATVDGRYAGIGTVGSGSSIDVEMLGRGGVPSSAVDAVVVNITAVGGLANGGFLTVFPAGGGLPNASSVNFDFAGVVANEVVAKLGSNGALSIYAYGGTDVIVDVVGWVPSGGVLRPLTPARLADTRSGGATVDGQSAGTGRLFSGGTLYLDVEGRGGTPSAGVDSVVLNVTVVDGGADDGFVSVYPVGSSLPNASSVNFRRGQTIANEIVVKVGSLGFIALYVYGGADLVVDVVGWSGSGAGSGAPTTPTTPTPPPVSNPDRFVAVYATPQGVAPVVGRIAAISHEVTVVQQWYDGQTGGRHPLFRMSGGSPAVVELQLPISASALSNSTSPESLIWAEIADEPSLAGAKPVVYLEGVSTGSYCGRNGGYMVFIPMDSCGIYPSVTSAWPYGSTYLLAHEVTHSLGAVPSCAPHHGNGSHVIDDPRDLVYAGSSPRDWANLMLDPGRDDYYLHGRSDCADIDDSPLLGIG